MRISVCFIVVFLSACSHLGSIANTNEPPEQHGTDIASSDNDSNDNASNNSGSNDDSLIAGQQGSQTEHAHSPDSGSISRDTFDSPNFGLARLTCDHPFEPANNDSLLLSYWPLEEAHASLSESITESDETGTTQSDIWDRIRSGFALDLSVKNKRIDVQFNWYQRNPKYIERTFNRASRYMYHIVEALEQHNMPLELALLPVVESAFDPFAYSHGRASGLWQFIPGTGKMYGMHQNWWYDGRRDVLASTQGAIDYLSFLNRRFQGNWLHALASYNTGSGRVAKAIRKNKKRGKATDFWHLKLPRETRAYVPKLLAISKLVADPERYGITLPSIPNRPVFDVVTFDSQLDLAQAANLAGLDIQELYRLNPGFNQWATPPQGPHRLLLPIEATQAFKENLAKLPKNSRVSWSRYSVKSGDSLIKIAKRFHTTPALIKQVNRLKNNTIRVKQKLLIPVASKKHEFYDLSSNNRLANKQQRIRAPKDTVKITHVVKEGDTMWDLSLKHKVGMRSIAKWNGMAPTDVLKPGRSLLIYSKTASSVANEPETPFIPGERQMIRRVGYKVRRGDSLARIANKFGVTVHQLVSWNKIDRKKYLQPGQKLTIYVDITRG